MKSKAGRRRFVLPDETSELLMRHEQVQRHERKRAGTDWQEDGLIFAHPNGEPIDHQRDRGEWKSILAEAGVREARLHEARHTAAPAPMLLRVPDRAAQDHAGWSSLRTKERYMHVTEDLRREIADQPTAASGASAETGSETERA